MTSVTAPVLYTSYETRPVTLCRKCGAPIGDEMVDEGHIVFLVDGLPSTEVILHPGCWEERERMKLLGFAAGGMAALSLVRSSLVERRLHQGKRHWRPVL
jgi:hypothetical protein